MPDAHTDSTTEPRTFHHLKPDYTVPKYKLPDELKEHLVAKLRFLYGDKCGQKCYKELKRILQVYFAHKTNQMRRFEKQFKPQERFTEKDIILITYGDLVSDDREKPLRTMRELLQQYISGVFSTIHILPFFPYSSDRGFAVMDFEEVDLRLGNWDNLLELSRHFKLMFDGVFNHVSSQSRWFQEFLNQNPDFADFFTVFSTRTKISRDHLKLIVRPRTSELLSSFDTLNGVRMVWTTFSPDQIDLNYHNPRVLLKMIEIMLTYVRRGADLLRLDAVTYLWEELGTSCVHLEQTHEIIRLFRSILDAVAPHVALITETNVPHEDNIRYFGNGTNEAQMVYNFALPPLVLHAFQNGDASRLTKWAGSLVHVSDQATYFNFLDSHDGIGVMAVRDILSPAEIDMMALRVLEHGGYISYKDNGDGDVSPYEMNITWWSAINSPDSEESMTLQVKRYIASRAVALALQGVPGVYLHGLLGSPNDAELVLEEKQTRSINRKNIRKQELIQALEDKNTTTYHVTRQLTRLIRIRNREKVFHPNSSQCILDIDPAVFCILRTNEETKECLISLINITPKNLKLRVPLNSIPFATEIWYGLVGKQMYKTVDGEVHLAVQPYQVYWLKSQS